MIISSVLSQKLSHLPVLRSVSFNDVHFGACPVCRVDGYRTFVITSLPHLQQLDSRIVSSESRVQAQKHFLQEVRRRGDTSSSRCSSFLFLLLCASPLPFCLFSRSTSFLSFFRSFFNYLFLFLPTFLSSSLSVALPTYFSYFFLSSPPHVMELTLGSLRSRLLSSPRGSRRCSRALTKIFWLLRREGRGMREMVSFLLSPFCFFYSSVLLLPLSYGGDSGTYGIIPTATVRCDCRKRKDHQSA